MSNHSGSYMLNDVLHLLNEQSVFDFLGKEKTQKLVLDIIMKSHQYDCNPGEILEGLGEQIGVCYSCCETAEEFSHEKHYDGICKRCYEDILKE